MLRTFNLGVGLAVVAVRVTWKPFSRIFGARWVRNAFVESVTLFQPEFQGRLASGP